MTTWKAHFTLLFTVDREYMVGKVRPWIFTPLMCWAVAALERCPSEELNSSSLLDTIPSS